MNYGSNDGDDDQGCRDGRRLDIREDIRIGHVPWLSASLYTGGLSLSVIQTYTRMRVYVNGEGDGRGRGG